MWSDLHVWGLVDLSPANHTYEVVKNLNRWAIVRDGVKVDCWSWRKTKKECIAHLPELQAQDEYRERILTDDRAPQPTWTTEEQEQIGKLASQLRENPIKRTLAGDMRLIDLARKHQAEQLRTIESWNARGDPSEHGKLVCAELRRQRAARALAFEQAGLELEPQPTVSIG